MLAKTLLRKSCELCHRPANFFILPICRQCLQKLPKPKTIDNVFVAFSEDVDLSLELMLGIAASRFFSSGKKVEAILGNNDDYLSYAISWFLKLPLVDFCNKDVLIVNDYYQKQKTLDNIQYLYLKTH